MDRKRGSLAYKRSLEHYPPSTILNRDKVEALALSETRDVHYGETRGLREPQSLEWRRNAIRIEKSGVSVFISHDAADRERLAGLVVYLSDESLHHAARVATTLVRVYALCAVNDEDAAMELLGDELEEMLRLGDTTEANRLLAVADPTLLKPSVTLVALTITSHAERASIPARSIFLTRAETALRQQLGADRAEALLARRR